MLQNARVTNFIVSELENQQGEGWVKLPLPPFPRLGLIPVLIKYQMQFVYLRTCVPLVIQIFFSLFLSSDEMHKGREEKLTRKKLNVDRQFFKNVLCNLITEGDSTNS